MYKPRKYRSWIKNTDLKVFPVTIKETDLLISATEMLSDLAYSITSKYRQQLEQYIMIDPAFATSFQPLPIPIDAPPIIQEMAISAKKANVGPMAAVAGAIAEYVGKELGKYSEEVIVENGGDIYLKIAHKRFAGLYAGESKLANQLVFEITPDKSPLGICTSSGTVSHSFSFGFADAVVIFSHSSTLSDAVATAICNMVKSATDIPPAIEAARKISEVKGIVIVINNNVGIFGDIKLADIVAN